MQKEIILNGVTIEYILKKSQGRTLRLHIKPGGILEVFKPKLMPEYFVGRFMKAKASWIIEKMEHQKKYKPQPTKKESRKKYLELKEDARKLVHEKLKFWKSFYQEKGIYFEYRKVSIKDSKTRWGSCSSKKNLNFSYKIISLPPQAQDYLIVHELSHLIHMNHYKDFWDLVSIGIKDYRKWRKELKFQG